MEFTFDLQMFGGKGGSTTNVQSYQPSEYELQLQKASANYADAVSPNAKWLNDVARGVLQNSLGTMQVNYDELKNQAREQNYQYMRDMYDSINGNNEALNVVQNQLAGLYGQLPGIVNEYLNSTNGIIDSNSRAANATNDVLKDISSAYGRNASQSNERLGTLIPEYTGTAARANGILSGLVPKYEGNAAQTNATLGGIADRGDNALTDANAQLDRLLGKSETTLDKYGDIRDQLIRGEIPSPYLQNMQDAIAGTMKRTAGEGLNTLANRGIINSSVSEGVLNDIEKNATDAVTGRYLDNINTINSLLKGQSDDALGLLGQQANLIGQRFGNTGTTLDRNINIANTQAANNNNAYDRTMGIVNTQTANSNNALDRVTGIINTQTANNTNALGQQANLTQQQLGNINNANNTNAGLLNQQYQNRMNTVGTQTGMINQYLQNQLGVQKQNAATLDGLLGHTADNITTAAAAQEAAQQPAQNLWNMSLGLQGSNTGALAAAAGKGTTTTTTSRNGGGGLFSGLLGGLF